MASSSRMFSTIVVAIMLAGCAASTGSPTVPDEPAVFSTADPAISVESRLPSRWTLREERVLPANRGLRVDFRDRTRVANASLLIVEPSRIREDLRPAPAWQANVEEQVMEGYSEGFEAVQLESSELSATDASGREWRATSRRLNINDHVRYVTFAYPAQQTDEAWMALWLRNSGVTGEHGQDLATVLGSLSIIVD